MVYEALYHARETETLNCLLIVLAKRNQQNLEIYFLLFLIKQLFHSRLLDMG